MMGNKIVFKSTLLLIGITGLFIFSLSGCSGNKSNTGTPQKPDSAVELNEGNVISQAEHLYKKHCLSCHQESGSGVPGMFPPLTGNPFIKGDSSQMILTILNGKQGTVTVNGVDYTGVMAPFKQLPDEDLALLVNYVRTHFGKIPSQVSPSDIKKLR